MSNTTIVVVSVVAIAAVAIVYYETHKPAVHKGFWDTVDDIGVSGNKYVGSSAAKILGAIGL